jgi:hypothetical protein
MAGGQATNETIREAVQLAVRWPRPPAVREKGKWFFKTWNRRPSGLAGTGEEGRKKVRFEDIT